MFDWIADAFWRWQTERKRWRGWEAGARAHGLFPAYHDFGGGIAVDREGEIWYSETPAAWTNVARVEQHEMRRAALGVAVRRHPELAHLWPARTAEDPPCPSCRGTGVPRGLPARTRHVMVCECGGMGWIAAARRPPGARPPASAR